MNIYYYIPPNPKPSWGVGMICYHILILNRLKFKATGITEEPNFKIGWLDVEIPVTSIREAKKEMNKDDFLIIPEFYSGREDLHKLKCRRIVFVQNAFYINDGLRNGMSYERMGFDAVFYYMSHLRRILPEFTSLPLYETPPFIAPYFFETNSSAPREKQILVYPKFQSRDYNILMYLLRKRLSGVIKPDNLLSHFKTGWRIVEIDNLTHKAVAQKMKKGAIFICLNTAEAFNSAIPEAMASGCINICYDGYGTRDILKDTVNAFVFPNNHIFELVDKVTDIVLNYDSYQDTLSSIRYNAMESAKEYSIENLEHSLLLFFESNRR